MKNNKMIGYGMFVLLIFVALGQFGFAVPEGGNATYVSSSSHTLNAAESLSALAGEVTHLTLDVNSSTKTWAGYYGNITGTLVLSTAGEDRIYEWNISKPRGEIYMVNDTVDFSSVECWNDTRIDTASYLTLAELESYLGVSPDAEDGVNETFSSIGAGTHDAFYVGTTSIDANSCPATNLLNATGEKETGKYEEVLMYDTVKQNVIYTALLEPNSVGFDGNEFDFQMIVGENGHTNSIGTTYFMYVEIE